MKGSLKNIIKLSKEENFINKLLAEIFNYPDW